MMTRRILQLCRSLVGPTLDDLQQPFAPTERAAVAEEMTALVEAGTLRKEGGRFYVGESRVN